MAPNDQERGNLPGSKPVIDAHRSLSKSSKIRGAAHTQFISVRDGAPLNDKSIEEIHTWRDTPAHQVPASIIRITKLLMQHSLSTSEIVAKTGYARSTTQKALRNAMGLEWVRWFQDENQSQRPRYTATEKGMRAMGKIAEAARPPVT